MKFRIFIVIVFLISCGKLKGPAGNSCSAQPVSTGVKINCTNGTSTIVLKGQDGTPGVPGVSGTSLVSTSIDASSEQCNTGGTVIVIANDTNHNNVYDLSDQNQQNVVICNGETGKFPLLPISTVAACGSMSSPWKEVLLCLSSGQILGDFSENASGLNTRLSFITDGNYVNTDSSGCNFQVITDTNGDTTINWSIGSNQYSSWIANTVICKNIQG